MYKVPKKLKMPISLAQLGLGIETEARFQDKLQRRFAIYCVLTLFSGLIIGFVAERTLGPKPAWAANGAVETAAGQSAASADQNLAAR